MNNERLTPDEEYYLTWMDQIDDLMSIRPPCASKETFLKLMAYYYDKHDEIPEYKGKKIKRKLEWD